MTWLARCAVAVAATAGKPALPSAFPPCIAARFGGPFCVRQPLNFDTQLFSEISLRTMLPTTPTLPGNVAGSPLSPGASPMMAPGAGAGNTAAAAAQLKAVMGPIHRALAAFPVGSKEYRAVLRALNALEPVFGAAQDSNLVPAAVSQMANAAKAGGSPLASVAPGLKPNVPDAAGGGGPPMAA